MDATEQSAAPKSWGKSRGRSSGVWRYLSARPGSREGLALGIVLALLASLPVLVAAIPQMADYASHLARYHVMLDGGRSPFLARFYEFDWRWTGNVGVDLLIRPFAVVFGLETGARIITAIIPALTGLGILAVEWALRRRIGAGSLLALALIWSPSWAMGFLNFGLSLALALLAFALWVRLEERRWRPLLFLPISLVVWACHMTGWGVLGVLVFGYELHRRRNLWAFLAPWPLLPPVLPLLFGGGTKGLLSYGKAPWVYKTGIWMQAMRDQIADLDMYSLGFLLALIAWALFRRRLDGRLGIAMAIFLVLTIAVPRHLGGGDYADYRLIAIALMVGCMAIDVPGPRLLLWLAPVLFLLRLAVTTQSWQAYSRAAEQMLTVTDHLPQGARVAAAVVIERSGWALDPFQHLPSYATVRKDALVNTHFAVPGVHMLHLREGGPDFADPSHRVFHRRGVPIDLSEFAPARHADYLWYVGKVEPTRLPAGATIVYRTKGSFLARLAPGSSRSLASKSPR